MDGLRGMAARAACVLAALTIGLACDAAAAERLEARMPTRADAAQQYALYLPDGASQHTPLLIVLDPRSRGEMARDLVLDGARARGWAVMSSWQSRSDTLESITLRALDALLLESANVPHDPKRVYLTGMSGTAKTLWVVAPLLRGRVAGLIGSGGGRPPEMPPLTADAPPFFGWTGTTDFNFQEMHALDDALARNATPHRLEVYDGPHGWPASPGFVEAIAWLDLQAMRAGTLAHDDAFLDARVATCRDDANATTDPLDRWRVFDHCVRDLDGLRDIDAFREAAATLDRAPEVRRLRALDARLLDEEARHRKRFEDWRVRFNTRYVEGRDQPPPSNATTLRELRIASLRKRALDPDPRVAASARRQLAWVHAGAASYLPPAFAERGDTARVEALKALADATTPP